MSYFRPGVGLRRWHLSTAWGHTTAPEVAAPPPPLRSEGTTQAGAKACRNAKQRRADVTALSRDVFCLSESLPGRRRRRRRHCRPGRFCELAVGWPGSGAERRGRQFAGVSATPAPGFPQPLSGVGSGEIGSVVSPSFKQRCHKERPAPVLSRM